MVADIREPKRVVVPSDAPPSELGLTRQLLKDGGEEKVVPPPGRNVESVKLRKSEEDGAAGALLALVSSRPGRQVEQLGHLQTEETSEEEVRTERRGRIVSSTGEKKNGSKKTDTAAAEVSILIFWEEKDNFNNKLESFLITKSSHLSEEGSVSEGRRCRETELNHKTHL